MSFVASERTGAVKPSAVLEMIRRAKALEGQGRKIAYLVQGEPDFDTPKHIRDAAYDAMNEGYTHYPPAEGYPDLQDAVAAKLERENGVRYDPRSEILITNGAALGLYLAVNAIVEPGVEVIIPDPAFGSYAMIVESAGGTVVRVPLAADGDRRRLDLEALEHAVTPRTRAVMICSPDNPTGHVMSETELRAIGDLAVEHGLIVIADEVYERFLYDGARHVSLAALDPAYRARTVHVNSYSKTYAMTGWRLGYNAAPAPIMAAMANMNAVAGRAAAAFTQRAGIAALTGPQDAAETMRTAYAARRTKLIEGLRGIPGLSFTVPQGAFYVFVDASPLGLPSDELALAILEHGDVVVTPGTYYGPGGAGYLRLSFASSDDAIVRGVAGMARAVAAIRGETA